MKPPVLALCASALLAALPASAQSLKPGLWEMKTKIASANPETMQALAMAQKEMANMPPEQRKMMEQMMAKNGMSLNLADGGGVAMKFCLTKEMAEKQELPSGQEGDCKTTRTPVPGGLNIAFKCSKPPSSGSGQIIFNGNTGYSMRMNVEGGGKAENMTVEGSGRWLAADCGAVKAK
ncbi:DUF3617 domain-containing protein [Massilia endophytica]|uniref:DUF3617 domain-containing protein n=1 Tax=Massilia endophytica TaxID=2899220 RepID=UPI001E4FD582|nr:DUF3617 domain-containing protein [Massilia endophytica]UGQ47842.1 DUF3617 domain-containing protein [Massilia endophytica]